MTSRQIMSEFKTTPEEFLAKWFKKHINDEGISLAILEDGDFLVWSDGSPMLIDNKTGYLIKQYTIELNKDGQ